MSRSHRRVMIGAWLVHLYTASGAVMAFLATRSALASDYRTAFFWLYLQVFVDATDGTLARRAQVSTRIPWFNGSKLDDIVDYLTYVFVPAVVVWRAGLVPEGWTPGVASAVLLASAYGFNRDDAKTGDHYFTGFPSYWNVVVFYLVVAGFSQVVNAAILLAFVILVFVPIRYLYPSRTVEWRPVTMGLGVVWSLLMIVMLWEYPAVSRVLFWVSLVYPVYYFGLSIALHLRAREHR